MIQFRRSVSARFLLVGSGMFMLLAGLIHKPTLDQFVRDGVLPAWRKR